MEAGTPSSAKGHAADGEVMAEVAGCHPGFCACSGLHVRLIMASSAWHMQVTATLCCLSSPAIGLLETFCHASTRQSRLQRSLRKSVSYLVARRLAGGYFHLPPRISPLISIRFPFPCWGSRWVLGLNCCETCTNASINQNVISL